MYIGSATWAAMRYSWVVYMDFSPAARRDDEVCSREESVEPSLLRESGRDLPGGVRSDLQGRLDVVDRDDLVALSGKPREEPTFPS